MYNLGAENWRNDEDYLDANSQDGSWLKDYHKRAGSNAKKFSRYITGKPSCHGCHGIDCCDGKGELDVRSLKAMDHYFSTTEEGAEKLAAAEQRMEENPDSPLCPFHTGTNCDIYGHRPAICAHPGTAPIRLTYKVNPKSGNFSTSTLCPRGHDEMEGKFKVKLDKPKASDVKRVGELVDTSLGMYQEVVRGAVATNLMRQEALQLNDLPQHIRERQEAREVLGVELEP